MEKLNNTATNNLVSLADRTTEEQRAIATLGGIKSGEVRKEKKIITEALKLILGTQVQDQSIKEQLEAHGVTQHTELMAMCIGMATEARKNPTAFKEIMDRIEGKVTDKIESNVNTTIKIEQALKEIQGDEF